MSHYCEFGPTNAMFGIEPCGAPAIVEIDGRWFCEAARTAWRRTQD